MEFDIYNNLLQLRKEIVDKIQKIYDNWERTNIEKVLNVRSKISQDFQKVILQTISINIPEHKKMFDTKLNSLYDNRCDIILCGFNGEKFIIKINLDIYEGLKEDNGKKIWYKIPNVIFKENDIEIIEKKLIGKMLNFNKKGEI